MPPGITLRLTEHTLRDRYPLGLVVSPIDHLIHMGTTSAVAETTNDPITSEMSRFGQQRSLGVACYHFWSCVSFLRFLYIVFGGYNICVFASRWKRDAG